MKERMNPDQAIRGRKKTEEEAGVILDTGPLGQKLPGK